MSVANNETPSTTNQNKKVSQLIQLITATRRNVPGTNEHCQRLRSCIFGMTILKGPPVLWVTINFADTKEPLVQVFAGEDIDMEHLQFDVGPSAEKLARNAIENPYAAAKAFFFLMKLFFEVLLGIRVSSFSDLERQLGILGLTEGYLGTVEAQGRGTLHAHLLIWLRGSPTSQEMQTLLKDPEFRERVCNFIKTNIHSHVDGLTEEYLKNETPTQYQEHKARASTYSRPLNPDDPLYEEKILTAEFSSARIHHLHECSRLTCLVDNGKKGFRCKRRAPWTISEESTVHEDGQWKSKRTLKWLNTWNPIIMLTIRSNHDIKLLTNAGVTRDVAWYTTKYSSKPQNKSYNTAALLATNYAYHKNNMSNAATLREANKKMLSQCVNTLTQYQELSSQQLVALIMGWGNQFESHSFVPIHLRFLMQQLKEALPELNEEYVSRF